MFLELAVSDSTAPEGASSRPAETSVVELELLPKHYKALQNLRPNTKVTLTLRGVVQENSAEAEQGSAGVGGCVKLFLTELSASRGSEFDELLDD